MNKLVNKDFLESLNLELKTIAGHSQEPSIKKRLLELSKSLEEHYLNFDNENTNRIKKMLYSAMKNPVYASVSKDIYNIYQDLKLNKINYSEALERFSKTIETNQS